MAKHQNPPHERPTPADKDDGYKKRHDHDGGDEDERAEHEIFIDLVQRRLGGGAPPTAEAYAKAMQQWQALAGAVQFVAVPVFPKQSGGAITTRTASPEKPNDGGDLV